MCCCKLFCELNVNYVEIEMCGATYLTIYKGRPQMPPKVRRIIFLRKDTFVQPWLIIHFVFWWIEGLVSILHILAALSKHRHEICPKKSHDRSFWCSKNYPPPFVCTNGKKLIRDKTACYVLLMIIFLVQMLFLCLGLIWHLKCIRNSWGLA